METLKSKLHKIIKTWNPKWENYTVENVSEFKDIYIVSMGRDKEELLGSTVVVFKDTGKVEPFDPRKHTPIMQ